MRNKYSLNRMIKPDLSLKEFLTLSSDTECSGIELRNDINDGRILDGMKPEDFKKLAEDFKQEILTINAIQKFNLVASKEKTIKDLNHFIEISIRCGCKMIVLCPNNEVSDNRSKERCYEETVNSLNYIGSLLKSTGIIGLLEPLGFDISSLRYKCDAVNALKDCDYNNCFKITHDTFHHYLSNEKELYPEFTGLVHVSGITEQLPKQQYTDDHRIFVTKGDVMANVAQITNLKKGGYSGYFSFEPFSAVVQNMNYSKLVKEIKASIDLLETV